MRHLDPVQHAFVLGPGLSRGAISPERIFAIENDMPKTLGGDHVGGIAPDRRIGPFGWIWAEGPVDDVRLPAAGGRHLAAGEGGDPPLDKGGFQAFLGPKGQGLDSLAEVTQARPHRGGALCEADLP